MSSLQPIGLLWLSICIFTYALICDKVTDSDVFAMTFLCRPLKELWGAAEALAIQGLQAAHSSRRMTTIRGTYARGDMLSWRDEAGAACVGTVRLFIRLLFNDRLPGFIALVDQLRLVEGCVGQSWTRFLYGV